MVKEHLEEAFMLRGILIRVEVEATFKSGEFVSKLIGSLDHYLLTNLYQSFLADFEFL